MPLLVAKPQRPQPFQIHTEASSSGCRTGEVCEVNRGRCLEMIGENLGEKKSVIPD